MKIRMQSVRYVLAWIVLLLGVDFPAQATTIERMTVEKISHTAQIILRARCLENSQGWDAGEIWTLTSFEVEDVWKGAAPSQITVRLLGGRVGNITSSVSGVPRFHRGEEVVLFLERTLRGDFSVVSWEQGTFRIRRNSGGPQESVTQDTSSFATFDPATRRFEPGGIRNVTLDTLRERVEETLRDEPRSK